nr:hypothetical protein [Acinetobacter marinus]
METSQQDFDIFKRNRAWRRKLKFSHRGRDCRHLSTLWKPEKNWKHLYGRSVKQLRSKQLGFEYPRISSSQMRLNAQYDYRNSIH